jgi:hypothetical protein
MKWVLFIVGGLLIGLALAAILPGSHYINIGMRSPGQPPVTIKVTPPITMWAPWVLIGGGVIVAMIGRNSENLGKIGASLVAAGVALLPKSLT